MLEQLKQLDATTSGGILGYVKRARKLLADSAAGKNPLEGWVPSVPSGINLGYCTSEFRRLEDMGLQEAGKSG